MTYKHINFQDSETMRSLVKVAHEKGMIKEDSDVLKALSKAVKSAKALDLAATTDVKENLLKLCAGLRTKGFAAYANKIEDRIAQLKIAETHMYNVHDETGEDLLEFAHPEGSPEVAPAENDEGTLEDLIEQHKKVKEIAEKSASTKMTKAEAILAVKLVLGFNNVDYPTFANKFASEVKRLVVGTLYKKDPWYSATLKNGKKTSDYFTSFHWRGINQIPDLLTTFANDWSDVGKREFIMGRTADLVHLVFELLGAIDQTIDVPGTPFTPKYARETMAALRPYAEMFESLFAKFHGNEQGVKYHGRSLPSDYLLEQANKTNAALDALVKKIDVRVIDDPDVKANAQLKAWFESEKQFINNRKGQFLAIAAEASAFEQKGSAPNRPEAGLVTIEVLREIIKKVNPKLLGDQDLKLGSLEEYTASLAAYPAAIQKDCIDALKTSLPEGAAKNQLLSYLS